jgi:hypothetical protein
MVQFLHSSLLTFEAFYHAGRDEASSCVASWVNYDRRGR